MRRATLWIGVALLGAACAKFPVMPPTARNDLYVLLPRAGGGVGALVITSEGREQTLSTPYAAAKLGTPGAIETTTVGESEMRGIFGAALTAQPPRPTSFLLYFLLDSDEMTPESQRVVADIVTDIARRPVPEVVVIGHTDTMGSEDHNDRLSVQRAAGVRTRLIEHGVGIPPSSIHFAGRGKRELLVPTADQVAEAKNRRVEIVVR
jgi:outer membrane protein OmpA-like peptidoglycan-associated protein